LLAKVPAFQNCVCLLGNFYRRSRTAVDKDNSNWLAQCLQGVKQLLLLANKIKARPVAKVGFGPSLTACLFGVANGQYNMVSGACGCDCFSYQETVGSGVGEFDFIGPPVIIFCNLNSLGKEDVGTRADFGFDPVEN